VCLAYAEDPLVVAAAIVGSVARGWADEYSDVEVIVAWDEAPSNEQRLAAVERSGGRIDVDWTSDDAEAWRQALADHDGRIGLMWPLEGGEYAEHFVVDGVDVGVSGFTVDAVRGFVAQLVDEHQPNDDAEMLASSLLDASDVAGKALLEEWRVLAASYPRQLSAAVMRRELEIDEAWWSIDALAARDERPALDRILGRMQERILRVLLALNRQYLLDPKPKWLLPTLARLEVKPSGIETVWRSLPHSAGTDQVAMMQDLFEATLDLVAAHRVGVDINVVRRWYRHRRPAWRTDRTGL
jgi:hypothetical protein